MAWEEIKQRVGARTKGGGVTVAWRSSSSRAAPVLAITIGRAVAERLGLVPGRKLVVARDRTAGLMRLQPASAGWATQFKDGCFTAFIPLDDIKDTDRRPSEAVEHYLEGDALILKLPDWAAPMRAGTQRAAEAAQQARARLGRAA